MTSLTVDRTQFRTQSDSVNPVENEEEMSLQSFKIVDGKYYFRCRVPKDLLVWFKGQEISKALHTSDKKTARILIAEWTTKVARVFYILKSTTVDEQFKKDLIRAEIYPRNTFTVGRSIRLSQLIAEYKRSHADAWNEKSTQENASSYCLIVDIIGDLALKHIEHEHILTLKEALQKLPSNMRKMPAYRDKKVSEILAMAGVKSMSITTANKHLGRFSTLLDYACNDRKYISSNPAANQTIAQRPGLNTNKNRKPFSDDDISALFNSLKRNVKEPERFWIPLIALFTGMRLNEICQLYKKDISKIENIWTIYINADRPDKRIKNEGAERIIPIPSE